MRETGAGLPDAKSLAALARVFDVEMEWLLDESEAGPQPRRAKQMQLMWYDWAAVAALAVSLIVYFALRGYVYEFAYVRVIYFPLALLRFFKGCGVWFTLGWSVSALACRFITASVPHGGARRAVTAAGVTALVLLIAFNAAFCILLAGVWVGVISVPAYLGWMLSRAAMFVMRNQALFLLPGALLSLCARRKAR